MEKWILAIAHASNIKQSWKAKHLLRGHPAWSIADKLPVLSESEVMHVEMFLESPKSMKQRFSSFFHVFSWAVHLPVEDQNEEHRLHCESLSWKRPNKGSLEGMHPGQSSSLPEAAEGKGVAVSGSLLAWPKALTDQVSQQALPKEAPGQWSPANHGLVTHVSHAHQKFMLIWILQTPVTLICLHWVYMDFGAGCIQKRGAKIRRVGQLWMFIVLIIVVLAVVHLKQLHKKSSFEGPKDWTGMTSKQINMCQLCQT